MPHSTPSVGELCKIVDPRTEYPHVERGEILYSNVEGDIRVGDILLVVGKYEGKFGVNLIVTKNGIETEVHSLFTKRYASEQ